MKENVDALVLLGDISHSCRETLESGVRLAAEAGLPVWAVAGNHDLIGRTEALDEVVQRVRMSNVRLATPQGEVVDEGLRIAGFSITNGDWGYIPRSTDRLDTSEWGDGPVLLISHYPIISFSDEVSGTGLMYGDDLEDLEEIAQPLLERPEPTVVLSGHIHIRYACVVENVLQVSCPALVEPPFEITLLDIAFEGRRIAVRMESVPLISSFPIRVSGLSPPRQKWVFEAQGWRKDGYE
ncbi:MAG: metallophosphoesterase [Rubrobacter sp.]|nr:metallophosphoesterase [Rubrobacter sp.]